MAVTEYHWGAPGTHRPYFRGADLTQCRGPSKAEGGFLGSLHRKPFRCFRPFRLSVGFHGAQQNPLCDLEISSSLSVFPLVVQDLLWLHTTLPFALKFSDFL